MKVDPQSVYLGMGIVGAVAGSLESGVVAWHVSLLVCLAGFLLFELLCLLGGFELLKPAEPFAVQAEIR